ncbi:hypothetical protein SAMN00790413_00283 [Deinococcus hopiensis KR-140]|uniref:Uncharacterized protein n=1 Tax=Deinococcus hopiensis KR-140 TaxID=695939 RepID=A0A1W1V759_9DEIO|nr:hypothetical protein SAMN00790413_00283 [Deinococcus hopiensis KR-140]
MKPEPDFSLPVWLLALLFLAGPVALLALADWIGALL